MSLPPPLPNKDAVVAEATRVLEANWSTELRCTLPHRMRYPHRWLWDSCFHVIAWASLGRPEAKVELESDLASRLPTIIGRGFVPHMVYGDPWRNGDGIDRGPLQGMSSFTQPPIYAIALTWLMAGGTELAPWLVPAASEALEWLWKTRLHDGLLVIVHPWESGADVSPRYDEWYGPLRFDRLFVHYDKLVKTTRYDEAGVAVANFTFGVAPSAFNGIAADAAGRLARLTGDRAWSTRTAELESAIDEQLWDESQQLWIDRSDVSARGQGGQARSSAIPTLDGVLGALGTTSKARAKLALSQCVGGGRFAVPFGPRYLPGNHPLYRPDIYWRGPTWPPLNFLLIEAAHRHGLDDIARELTATTLRGIWASHFSEYWNPETGEGRGATPQSWAAIAAALTSDQRWIQ